MIGKNFFHNYRKGFIICITIVLILLLTGSLSVAQDMSEIIKGAKKEGKVIYYSAMTMSHSQLMADEFQKKYPFIKVELLRMSGEKLLVRAITEAVSLETLQFMLEHMQK